jgi:hypothetical protein
MPSRYDELKAMAEDCRRLAAAAEAEHIRFQLLAVAEHFELQAEQQVRPSPKPPSKS